MPEGVKVMSLTATATIKTRKAICKSVGLINPVIISESPHKPNIKYIVQVNPPPIEETFAPLIEEVRRYRQLTDRAIIFCRTYDSMTHIYLYFKNRLGKEILNPMSAPDMAQFRLIDMFSACTQPDVKEEIIRSFSIPNSQLRVVIATIAFGMGIDCSNVRRIMHWGASDDVEQYLQESGRAGRDHLLAHAILYHKVPDVVTRDLSEDMKEYCINKSVCRRTMLFKKFNGYTEHLYAGNELCQCCDICECVCMCAKCSF